MGQGHGFGKVILFNEHFVVYGVPAIVSAIGDRTVAKVTRIDSGFELVDDRPATPGYKEDKAQHQADSFKYMFEAMGLDMEGIRLELGGNLYAASGVGASAASCAAIARALSNEFNLNLSDEDINKVAWEGERGYHGNPSGIDNTAATYGGLLLFKRGDENIIDRMNLPQPVRIVMGNTGVVANTKAAVAGVKERKEQDPGKYEELFKQAGELAVRAKEALEKGDWPKVGELMVENHALLQEIQVSNDDLDMLVETARKEGAIGAKMTGGGLGGYMVALTPDEAVQKRVADAIEAKGFSVLRTTIGI